MSLVRMKAIKRKEEIINNYKEKVNQGYKPSYRKVELDDNDPMMKELNEMKRKLKHL